MPQGEDRQDQWLRVTNAATRGSRGLNARTTRGSRTTNARTRGSRRTDAMESLMPTFPLATMVFIIKILVITLTNAMSAPIGILLFKILPVMRIALIPRIPLRRIPVIGSDNIGGRISVIRGPAILIAEELLQYSI